MAEKSMYAKWLTFARHKAEDVKKAGFRPVEITIKDWVRWNRDYTVDEKNEWLNRYKNYPVDIYCDFEHNSPIADALRDVGQNPDDYWLRCDYSDLGWVFEVLPYGSYNFSDADYTGYIFGNEYGNKSLNTLRARNIKLVHYDEAW